MAILAECPQCHKKQAVKNRLCDCGADLVKLKRSGKVRYWIQYRMPGGKQRKEYAGMTIEEASASEGKRRAQKYENPRLLKKVPEDKMTFKELADWYLGLATVQGKAYYPTLQINLASFNAELGDLVVGQIKATDLENYQAKRKAAGYSDSYVDQEITAAKTVVNKAFDNDLVSGETVKVFKRIKKLLKRNANARDKVLTLEQFDNLMGALPHHSRAIVATAFYTGMRRGEVIKLTWDKVDLDARVIRLTAQDTKDKEAREIPIPDGLLKILEAIPKAIHDKSVHKNHVFLYRGKPIKDLRTALIRACKEVKIPYGRFVENGFVFHDLRHTFNTFMRRAGVPESVIMEITGHSTREMFDRYSTIDQDDKRQAVDQLQDFLGDLNRVTHDVTQAEEA